MKKLYTIAILSIAAVMVSCSRESDEATVISDEALISMVHQTDVTEISSSVARLKGQDIRIRMNAVARSSQSIYGDRAGTYAVNSMLVKEYLNDEGGVTGYDVMYKAPADPNSSGGWLWASYDSNANPVYGVNLRGNSCNSCHGRSNTLVLGEQ